MNLRVSLFQNTHNVISQFGSQGNLLFDKIACGEISFESLVLELHSQLRPSCGVIIMTDSYALNNLLSVALAQKAMFTWIAVKNHTRANSAIIVYSTTLNHFVGHII